VFQTLLRLGENGAGLFGFGTGQYLEFRRCTAGVRVSGAITRSNRSVLRGIKSTESPCGGAGCNEAVRFAYEYRTGSGKMVNDGGTRWPERSPTVRLFGNEQFRFCYLAGRTLSSLQEATPC